jgi:hypothetical protein
VTCPGADEEKLARLASELFATMIGIGGTEPTADPEAPRE